MQPASGRVKSRRVEHAEDTRRALLRAARALFAERGYADAGIDEIARSARVTRGALYHHFASKQDLFDAVVQDLYSELIAELGARFAQPAVKPSPESPGGQPDVWDLVCAGYQTRLDLVCADPAFQVIVDRDAAAVLGYERLSEIAQGSLAPLLRPALDEAVSTGLIEPIPIDVLADLLGALISTAGRRIAVADDKDQARLDVGEAVAAFLQGLRRAQRPRLDI